MQPREDGNNLQVAQRFREGALKLLDDSLRRVLVRGDRPSVTIDGDGILPFARCLAELWHSTDRPQHERKRERVAVLFVDEEAGLTLSAPLCQRVIFRQMVK